MLVQGVNIKIREDRYASVSMDTFIHAASTIPPDIVDEVGDTANEAVDAVSNWWDDPVTRQWVVEIPLKIIITLVLAALTHAILRRVIDRLAKRNIDNGGRVVNVSAILPRSSDDETSREVKLARQTQEERRQARVRTLAGVFKSAIAIVIWAWAALAILSEVGINVGPIIASAGVVGVALGFGAQSLVKDFLSGIFMLIEDQYGVGDTVDVGNGVVGDVEEITLRVTTIRDIDGTLWYVRNGEILTVGNHSDEFAIARIDIPIALTNDTEHATDVILNAANDIVRDPAIVSSVLEEPTLNGVTSLQADQMSVRLSVKTLPGKQWSVQRLIQARMVNVLRQEGITMPYLHGIGGAALAVEKKKEEN